MAAAHTRRPTFEADVICVAGLDVICVAGLDVICVAGLDGHLTHPTSRPYCPLHISRRPDWRGLRCSRRQIGTEPSAVVSGPHIT